MAQTDDWSKSRYMETPSCTALDLNDDLVRDFPVIRPYIEAGNKGGVQIKSCTYRFYRAPPDTNPQYGWVVLANPSGERLDKWINVACKKRTPKDIGTCVTILTRYIRGQSGGQFPVTGFVSEGPDGDLCKQYTTKQNPKGVPYQGLIAFEDGVTVQRVANPKFEGDSKELRQGIYCSTDGWGEAVQQLITKTHPIGKDGVYKKARLAGLDRSCGAFVTDDIKRQAKQMGLSDPWLLATRLNHIAAILTDEDAMMVEQAKRIAKGVTKLDSSCQ